MEDQNTSIPGGNIFGKILSRIFRGIIWGVIGGVILGIVFGVINGLSETFSDVTFFTSDLFILTTAFEGSIIGTVVTLSIPIGFVIGISTGILAAIFRHHCPNLLLWLVLSWIGVIIGFGLSGLGSNGWLSYGFLLEIIEITFISLAASWMAYKFTIQEIKKDVPKETSRGYTILAAFSNLLLIFIMIYQYFKFWNYLKNIPS